MELENISAYPEVCHKILKDLSEKLPEHLAYHCLEHTIDVANVCNHYIDFYMISKHPAHLIRIASIAHDYGYIFGPKEHEERGIQEVRPLLTDYSDSEISVIEGLIRATKVPQEPRNLYEEIISDADLDYIGRKDYSELSEKLYLEFLHFGVVQNELDWLNVQVRFLESHKYHTTWAKIHRSGPKQLVLQKLRDELNSRNLSKKAS
jgi:hypothetical protein